MKKNVASRNPDIEEDTESRVLGADTKLASQEGAKALRELLAPVRNSLRVGQVMAVISAICGVFPFVALVGIGNTLVESFSTGAEIDRDRVSFWVMVLISAFCTRLLVYFIGLLVTHLADSRLSVTIQKRIVHQLSLAPLTWFGENNSGHVRKALQDDVKNLHMLVAHRPVDSLVAILLPLFCGIYAFVMDWRLGILVVLSIPIYGLIYSSFMRGSSDKTLELDAKLDRVSSAMIEFVKGIQVVKTFGIVGKAHERYAKSAAEACDFMEEWNRPMVNAAALTASLVSTPVIVLVVGVGGSWMVSQGWVSIVEVVAGCLIAIALPDSINLIANLAWNYQLAGAAAKRIIELVNVEVMEAPARSLARPANSKVEIQNVSVSYGLVKALRNVSVTCEPGTVTALIGPSGAGKSTLAKLVARFLDPDEGEVRIGGVKARDLCAEDLYKNVSFVLQDAQLIRASIRDNIAMGRPQAKPEEIQRVARLAQIHEEILELPRGYDTVVGQDVKLSGGQQQRLAIARALLIDAPILILDEAAAMVDPECEAQIQQAINYLTAGRTVIVIDHRPASVKHADQIVALEHGEVVAAGTHEELQDNPLYQRLLEASGANNVQVGV